MPHVNTRSVRKRRPIGVFDSGVGGLTVVKALRRLLPNEDIVYFGDTARVPYGTKSPESIIRFSKENVKVLLKYQVKMVVVACNSSSSHAIGPLRKTFKVPIIGVIEPGVKSALAKTRNNRVGIIATPATVNSGAYTRQLRRFDKKCRAISQACPLFVPLVEEGWFSRKETILVANQYLKKLKKSKVDTLILGCTHYPLLKGTLRKVMGQRVQLIDSAQAVAGEVRDVLKELGLNQSVKRNATYKFLVSDQPDHFLPLARRFLRFHIKNVLRRDHIN